MRNFWRISILLVTIAIFDTHLGYGQTSPAPTDSRELFTYFPDSLVCDQVVKGDGPSTGLVTIGRTTLEELEAAYSPYFDVSIGYSEVSGETTVFLKYPNDGSPYELIDVCVIDDVIVAAKGDFPSVAQIHIFQHETASPHPPEIPVSFEYLGIKHFIAKYGIPDVVTYSTEPTWRIAFWFEQGVAAEFYIVNVPSSQTPSSFGAFIRVIYFPFQDVDGYENRWPYNQTYPEERYLSSAAPYVATDVPIVRNPFDFDSIFATLTAVPYPALTPTPSPAS